MPTVLRQEGFRFYFYSDEGDEPCHIHVKKGDGRGKIWLEPDVESDYFYGFNKGEVRKIHGIVIRNIELLKRKWYEYFKK